MNRYMPLVMLVVLGQASIAFLLVDRIVIRRIEGPPVEDVAETRVEISVSDEPERVYRDLGEFLINPADSVSKGGLRFIRAQVSLGVSPVEAYRQIDLQTPKVRDAIVRILSAKKVEELDNPEDREFIKDEIRFAVNRFLVRGEVLQVYFSEFTIQ